MNKQTLFNTRVINNLTLQVREHGTYMKLSGASQGAESLMGAGVMRSTLRRET